MQEKTDKKNGAATEEAVSRRKFITRTAVAAGAVGATALALSACDEKKEEKPKQRSKKPKKLKSTDEYSPVGEENSARDSKL